ncbi:hypothetical protein CKAN_02678500 [Cinnamomum micranthum f. kanehirae]|uniref:Uncharacterized protein n=1 Tax=Cinnamomum micranthum f. kanehirae TaxID=337451 RepID=A0A443Q2Y1_9MAGN|nr:hypothetical protein CKAN_02678500 [Cinnamomum micranthum f. kanehirae]
MTVVIAQILLHCYNKTKKKKKKNNKAMVMEALGKFTETWKQCPQETLLLFISMCVMGLAVGLCASSMSKKKRLHSNGDLGGEMGEENGSGWGAIKNVLVGSVCWSRRSRLSEKGDVDLQKMPTLLAGCREVEWSEISSPASPLWQRRILMGERCELPKFSGLILYDERGHPLHHSNKASTTQERPTAAVKTTLRDLL